MRLFLATAGEVLLFGAGWNAATGSVVTAIGLFLGFVVCIVALTDGTRS